MAARAKKTEGGDGPGFEARLEALEGIVKALEGEGLTLEEALARYQEGVRHLVACRALLDGAEKRLLELVERPDGSASERSLSVGESGLVPADDEDA